MTRITLLTLFSVLVFISCSRNGPGTFATAPSPPAGMPEKQDRISLNHSISPTGDFTYTPRKNDLGAPPFRAPENDFGCGVMQSLRQEPQLLVVSTGSDTIIMGEKGTQVLVPAHAFVFADGSPVQDSVRLELKECYAYSDMLCEGLSTHTDTSTLQSAGMIDIEAFSGKEPLKLKTGSELLVRFNNEETNENYKLYYGDVKQDGDITWNLDPLGDQPSPVIIDENGRFAGVSDVFFQTNYRLDKETMLQLLDKRWTCSASFDVHGNVNGRTYYDNGGEQEGMKDAEDKFSEIVPSLRKYMDPTSFPANRVQFNFACTSLEKFLQLKMRKEVNQLTWKFMLESISLRKGFYARMLGWLNCDASPFLKAVTSPVTLALGALEGLKKYAGRKNMFNFRSLAVKLNSGPDDQVTVRLAFAKMKTIIPGNIRDGQCLFDGIPEGKEVYVIATLFRANKIFMAMEKVNIRGDDNFVSLKYKEYPDAKSIEGAFSELNSL